MKIQYLIFLLLLGVISECKSENNNKQPTTINDFSRLNETKIHAIVTPSSYQELHSYIDYAKKQNLNISVMGSRHSQGGHAFYSDALVVSLQKLNKVTSFYPDKKIITVQAGATWKEVQEFLNPHGLAVKIMQFANLFTVGGSLSVNCNGIDPHCGPLIESVHSIKILCADGSIVHASRTENSELFHLAIGGYGLFGIILEVTLDVVENSLYKRETTFIPLADYPTFIKKISKNPEIGFHYAFIRFHTYGKKLFSDIAAFTLRKVDQTTLSERQIKKTKELYHESFIDIKKYGISLWANYRLMKAWHWIQEAIKHGTLVSRNNVMRPPASHLFVKLPQSTNLLQEYFIPVDNINLFIEKIELITEKLQHNLMHVALRFIPKNTESFLSYTKHDCIGVVLFFNQEMSTEGNEKTETWTKKLIDTAIALNGTYYLPIQLHADSSQIRKAYPNIDTFFAMKRKYDPHLIFMNTFYAKYAN